MQIAQARTQAERFLGDAMIHSRAKRPPANARVMCRYPRRDGDLIMAPSADDLREKLAKRIQYRAKRRVN